MASDQPRLPGAGVCPAQEYAPGQQILRATAAASAWRAAQRGWRIQSPALPQKGPAHEKLRRAANTGNRTSRQAVVCIADKHMQLALATRDKRKVRVDEAVQCAASAVRWSDANGCD